MSNATIEPKKGFIGHSGEFYTDSDEETTTNGSNANITRRKSNESKRKTQRHKKHYPPKGLDDNYELDDNIIFDKLKKPMPSATIFPVDYDVKTDDNTETPVDDNKKPGGRKSAVKRRRKNKTHKKRTRSHYK